MAVARKALHDDASAARDDDDRRATWIALSTLFRDPSRRSDKPREVVATAGSTPELLSPATTPAKTLPLGASPKAVRWGEGVEAHVALPIREDTLNEDKGKLEEDVLDAPTGDPPARGFARTATEFWSTVRKRRNSIRQLRALESGVESPPTTSKTAGKPALDPPLEGLTTLAEVLSAQQAAAAPSGLPPPSTGVLAALMALQKEEAALWDRAEISSATSSALPTPLTSLSTSPISTPLSPIVSTSPVSPTSPLSPAGSPGAESSSDDDSDRERFIAGLREKRAKRSALQSASASVASASKHAASTAMEWAMGHGAGHGPGGRNSGGASRSKLSMATPASLRSSVSSPTASPGRFLPPQLPTSPASVVNELEMPPAAAIAVALSPPLMSQRRTRSAASLLRTTSPTLSVAERAVPHRSHSSNTLSCFLSSHSPPSTPVSLGAAVPHRPKLSSELSKRVRRLGDRLGLELETSRTRPQAARSGAGVFGGLVLSTTSLVAPATPYGSSIAPIATSHGYRVSRVGSPTPSATVRPLPSRPPSPETLRPCTPPSRRSPELAATPSSNRKSLVDLVREEEERDCATEMSLSLSPSRKSSPTRAGTVNAAQLLHERRRRKKRAAFTLQLNDQPVSPPIAGERPSGGGAGSRRPSLTIDTSAPRPNVSPPLPSPTSPGRRRFLGGLSPRSPNHSFSSLHRDYFGNATALASPGPSPAEQEIARAERKAREAAERAARQRAEDLREWEKERRRRRKAKEKELKRRRVFITAHVAALIAREDFLLKLARAFMMFGAPSHRLEAQIQATAGVLEMPHCAAMYIPSCLIVNFGDPATATSDIRILKQATGLDIGRLKATYSIYSKVIRDKMGVIEGSKRLDELMLRTQRKRILLRNVLVGGLCGALIMPSAFYASFIDCLAAIPLGALLVVVQYLLARNDLYSSLFEVVIACINALIAGGLSYTHSFCFYSVAAGSIVLILPGFIFLSGALELANRCLISGAVRLTYGTLYSLFLGFGLSVGAEIYTRGGREASPGGDDYTCAYLRSDAPWYRSSIPQWCYFVTVPAFLACMAVKNGQPLFRRDSLAMVVIGSAGFAANFFSAQAFVGSSALVSFIGSFVVGVLGNTWAQVTRESAFVVMIVGIFIQLPSGLANGGLLRFAADSTSTNSFRTAIDAAASIVQVAVGLTVGLYLSTAAVHLVFRRGHRRGAHLSTF